MRTHTLAVMEGCGRVRARARSSCGAVIRSSEKLEQFITLLPSEGEPSLPSKLVSMLDLSDLRRVWLSRPGHGVRVYDLDA